MPTSANSSFCLIPTQTHDSIMTKEKVIHNRHDEDMYLSAANDEVNLHLVGVAFKYAIATLRSLLALDLMALLKR